MTSTRREKDYYPPLLGPGFHALHIENIDSQLVQPFGDSTARRTLATGLKNFVHFLRARGVKGELWIDGSFMTHNPRPKDVDVVLLLPHGLVARLSSSALADLYYVTDKVNRVEMRARYGCDIYCIRERDFSQRQNYKNLFSRNGDSAGTKGIAVITL